MTIHMERPSVPEHVISDRQVVRRADLAVERSAQATSPAHQMDNAGVAALRERGRQNRAVGKADRFERLAAGRDTNTRFVCYAPVPPRLCTHRDTFSGVTFDRHSEDAYIPTHSRGSDNVRRGAVEIPASAQRSIERMQTISAAALGVIAGFILFLFLLYAG